MDKIQTKHYIDKWQRAGPVLERLRQEDIRNADTAQAMETLSGCINQAIREVPPKPYSGLLEMQRYFKLLHEAEKYGK